MFSVENEGRPEYRLPLEGIRSEVGDMLVSLAREPLEGRLPVAISKNGMRRRKGYSIFESKVRFFVVFRVYQLFLFLRSTGPCEGGCTVWFVPPFLGYCRGIADLYIFLRPAMLSWNSRSTETGVSLLHNGSVPSAPQGRCSSVLLLPPFIVREHMVGREARGSGVSSLLSPSTQWIKRLLYSVNTKPLFSK